MSFSRWKKSGALFTQQPAPQRPKRKWVILPVMWRGFLRVSTFVGAFVLISIFLMVWTLGSALEKKAPARLPNDMVLILNFDGGVSELPATASFSDPFGLGPLTLKELVDAMAVAKTDKRVRGIVARLDAGSFDMAHVQELRLAIKDFQTSGKFAYLYSSSLGEMTGGLGRYLLASSFDEIWMQPLGVVSIPGINAEMPFFRASLEKIGVTPEFFQRKEYKNAYESMTNEHMSGPSRASMHELVDDLKVQIVDELSAELKRPPQAIEMLINKGLFTAQEALKERLITKIGYADELSSKILEDLTGDPKSEDIPFVDMSQYARNPKEVTRDNTLEKVKPGNSKAKIALIYAVGVIMPTADAAPSPLTAGQGTASAEDIASALFMAADDPDIQAVVLRIDSPGGSPVASEDILRAVEKTQEAGKPVIVSMGAAAASGGYWIASYADRIFVLPGTLTGSIGVVGGKFALDEMWNKLGVNWEGVSWGQNSGIWSFNTPFTPSEAERFNAMLDQVYNAFVARVAKGREMSPESVEKIAKGHVWTGAKAVEIGLADEIGGLNDALDYTAGLLAKTDRHELDVQILPAPQTPFERLMGKISGESVISNNSLKVISDFAKPVAQQIQMMQRPDLYTVYQPITVR